MLTECSGNHSRFVANCNKQYIGLKDGNRGRTFIHFRPRRKKVLMLAETSLTPEIKEAAEDAGFAPRHKQRFLEVTVTPDQVADKDGPASIVLRTIIKAAFEEYGS